MAFSNNTLANGNGTLASPRPLQILIVGAGIGGLTAAIALRQQGHDVQLFEQSRLAQETGAAIHIASNCNSVLRRLGLDVEKSTGGVECNYVAESAPDGTVRYNIDTTRVKKKWAYPWVLVHRAHLHTQLKRMATAQEGKGKPAKLNVASRVASVNAETATVKLEDGTTVSGDLLVGADGVHSRTRKSVPGGDVVPFDSGKSAFRFLVPTEKLAANEATAAAVARPGQLTMWVGDDRRLIMYPCDSNKTMNFVAIHPSAESDEDITGGDDDWQETGNKSRMLQIYSGFCPTAKAILELADAEKLNVWKLLDMKKLPTFISGKLALLGDSAHPFLPHQGQGGAMAIEDGAALAALLPLGTTPDDIASRLKLYEECRYERAHKIQEFTRMAGKDTAELAAAGQKLDMMGFQQYNFMHDAWDNASSVLQKYLEAKASSTRTRGPVGFGPAPGPRSPLGSWSLSKQEQESTRVVERSETTAIRFRTTSTFLQSLLPQGFSFSSSGSAAEASILCTTLSGMKWLSGGGYNHLGLYIHGTEYTKSDGSKITGTYLSVLFEDMADPIITGRAELGMPKLYAGIDITPSTDDASRKISLSWQGHEFGSFELDNVRPQQANGEEKPAEEVPFRGPTLPPPPPDQGLLWQRYVPSVGEPGKTDAEYAVFYPKKESSSSTGSEAPSVAVAQSAKVQFTAGDWQQLPTLHHIASRLAAMPILEIVEAKVIKGSGVDDLASARRIE